MKKSTDDTLRKTKQLKDGEITLKNHANNKNIDRANIVAVKFDQRDRTKMSKARIVGLVFEMQVIP